MRGWYVASTRPHQERRALENLARQNFVAWLPQHRKSVRHARAMKSVLAPFFPGYLFVELDPSSEPWRHINGTFGVNHLLTAQGGRPMPLPDGFVASLKARMDDGGCIGPDPEELQPGCKVRVMQGAMGGLIGTLLAKNGRERVTMLLQLLGTEVRTTLPRSAVQITV